MYIKIDWKGDGKRQYAAFLPDLYTDRASGKEPKLMDRGFADAHGLAGTPKQGYRFQECKTIGGKPIDWAKDFALCATPSEYGVTAEHTLIISSKWDVWFKDLGKSELIDDFPADPKAAGWSPTAF